MKIFCTTVTVLLLAIGLGLCYYVAWKGVQHWASFMNMMVGVLCCIGAIPMGAQTILLWLDKEKEK